LKTSLKYTIFIIALILYTNCKKEKQKVEPKESVVIDFKKEGVLKIKKADTDSVTKTLDIEIADNEYETQTGLMYREELKTNHGMLFIFPNSQLRSFYMKNTKIPLDIVYIDKDKSIVSFQKNAKPFNEASLPSKVPAKYVLEINGGMADKWLLEVGDKIEFKVLNDSQE